MAQLLFLVLEICLAGLALATSGVDVSQPTMPTAFKCLKENGCMWRGIGGDLVLIAACPFADTFAVIRCYQSSGQPDANCPHTIYNAWGRILKRTFAPSARSSFDASSSCCAADAGMAHVDIYFFPAPKRGDAAGQMQSMVTYLGKYNVKVRIMSQA